MLIPMPALPDPPDRLGRPAPLPLCHRRTRRPPPLGRDAALGAELDLVFDRGLDLEVLVGFQHRGPADVVVTSWSA